MIHIAYYRVSTTKQGISGLGLEAQEIAVERAFGVPLISFTEVESGKNNHRPELQKAIAKCIELSAVLVVGKLDRLSRNVSFISNLMDSKVRFKCADMPLMDNFTIHLFAAMAQREAEITSKRTKDALGVLRAKGVKLGIPVVTIDGKLRSDIIRENRSKRVYSTPDRTKIETLKILKKSGAPMDKIKEVATQLFGKEFSQSTIYNYLAK